MAMVSAIQEAQKDNVPSFNDLYDESPGGKAIPVILHFFLLVDILERCAY